MKKIFNYKALVATACLSLLVVFSCKDSFLEIKPAGQLSEDALASKAGLEGLLIGSYSMLNANGYSRLGASNNWVFGSICGGDANKGTNAGDYTAINPIERYESISTNGDINDTYRPKYEGIARANNVLRLLKKAPADVSAADQARLAGEARFLRGHYYFELKKIFNNTPYVDESTPDATAGTVTNDADLWPKIEADLKFAYENLPETQGAAGRANKWAAACYLAKAYLFQKKFDLAKPLFDAAIANGKTTNGKKYALLPKYADVFNAANDNHAESVFAMQSAANTGSTNNSNWMDDLNYPYNTGAGGPGNCCGFFQPSFELANSFRTNAAGLPLLDGSYNLPANELVTDHGKSSATAFTPDAGRLDPRIDHSLGRRTIPYLDWKDFPGADWIRDEGYAGPYSPKKFIYYKSQEGSLTDGTSWTRGYAAMNYCIIRFADVLLMAAECEIDATGGSLAKAQEYVNMVRTRGANPDGRVKKGGVDAANYVINNYTTAWTVKADARTAVYFERKLELSGEGHRFFDLVRWGLDGTAIPAYLNYEKALLPSQFAGATYTAKSKYQPIPQGQIDLQKGALKQNPGY
jgi:starch-binding outer membrane protein, SusD/RagB family